MTPTVTEKLSNISKYDPGLMSDENTETFLTVNHAILASIVATVGIATNFINIVVFIKQGFGDTVNVSLFGLALSDLCSLITLQWVNLLRNPLFINSGVPILGSEVQYLSGGWPHGFFTRLTSGITAYITFERCLCVMIPLKVKSIATPRLAVTVFIIIFILLFLALLPDYATAYIGWKFDLNLNKTMLGLVVTDRRAEMFVLSFTLAAYILIIFFLAVVMFTVVLVVKMKQMARWRASTASFGSGSGKETQGRDNRAVKMIILIAIIYCICYIPFIAIFITTSVLPEFSVLGRYQNMFVVSWSFAFLVDSVHASSNLFVYYSMSTKYRQTFDSLFRRCRLMGAGLAPGTDRPLTRCSVAVG